MSTERFLEKFIIASRWLQAPLYVGLVGVLVVICIRFFSEFVHVTAVLRGGEESKLVLLVVIHLTFVVSALMLAWLDKLAFGGKSAGQKAP